MKRRVFLKNTTLAAAGGLTVINLPVIGNNLMSFNPDKDDVRSSFVRISKENPYYFELSNGDPYIPVGANVCWARDMTTMESYFQKLAENGGNFLRIWLSNPLFEIIKTDGTGINQQSVANVDKLFELAKKHKIRMKMCLESFRSITAEKRTFNRPDLLKANGGPFSDMAEYINSEAGRKLYLDRVEFLRNRYGNNPAVFGWELWNEMNAINHENILEWNEYMLAEVHKKFPENLVLQSLGSFDTERARKIYRSINQLQSNDVGQIHRYLDQGASLDICKGPVDLLASDALEELRSYQIVKPMLLAETGGVKPKHTGPSELYPLDKEGTILHDILFTPFFSGSAGPGHAWHWDAYVDNNNLWYHFQRFNECIKGINPVKERFIPIKILHSDLRIYILAGSKTILIWCRDTQSNWDYEFVKGLAPNIMKGLKFDISNIVQKNSIKLISAYDPWNNKWSTINKNSVIGLPDFKRSVVIKIEKV
jgi:hypothetical protein